jgi:hypothetical protein
MGGVNPQNRKMSQVCQQGKNARDQMRENVRGLVVDATQKKKSDIERDDMRGFGKKLVIAVKIRPLRVAVDRGKKMHLAPW